ncbi:hypothetical protein [Alkalihalobacterium bogoriense]|uniref:hypothetical protein n=1 Tax=Alkalihalobacterium bogoriense TaxID=246272 RepID=UPI000479BD91|nr:hypothetical protein [Alkalihalobacterium bogoriense]
MKSLQEKVKSWIGKINVLDENSNPSCYYFIIEQFADEPTVYLRTNSVGVEIGYVGVQWYGHIPVETNVKKLALSWEDLKLLSKEEQENNIIEMMLKTINSRKRQYRKCQYCQEKIAPEHRYDKNTCHSCASEHLNIVY